jgi:hypothetical protein
MKASALCIVVLALLVPACGSETSSPGESAGSETSAEGLPAPVADKRSAILAAAEKGDYEALRPLIDREVFLSDFGFGKDGPDPVDRWQEMGPKPLQMMGVLLRMPHAVRETNEGTLYQWPIYDPNSRAGDLSAEDRKLFRTIMTEDELENLILPELGYTAPRLGLLADGGWWFFILEGEG